MFGRDKSHFNVDIGIEDHFSNPLKGLSNQFARIKGESSQAFKSLEISSRDNAGNLVKAKMSFASAGSEVANAASGLGAISFAAVGVAVLAVASAAAVAVGKIVENVSDQMKTADTLTVAQFQGAQGLSIATGMGMKSAQDLLESGSKDLQKIAAALPGATSDYVQSFSALSPAVATLIRGQNGQIDKALFKSTLEKSAEVSVIFGRSSRVGTDIANSALNKLMQGTTGFNTVLRNDFFEKNVALTQALKSSLAQSNIKPEAWGKATGMQRAEVLNRAYKMVLSKEAIKMFSNTLDGVYQGFVSQFYFVQTETKINGVSTTSYKEFVRAFGAVFGEKGIANQILRLFGVNTQSIADTVTPWLSSLADNLTLVADALSKAKKLSDIPKVLSQQFEGIAETIFSGFNVKLDFSFILDRLLPDLLKSIRVNVPIFINNFVNQISNFMVAFPDLISDKAAFSSGKSIGKLTPLIAGAIGDIGWAIIKNIPKLVFSIGVGLYKIISKLGSFAGGLVIGAVTSIAADIGTDIANAFKGIFQATWAAVKNFFSPVTSAIASLKSAFDSIANWVSAQVNAVTGLVSPLPGASRLGIASKPTSEGQVGAVTGSQTGKAVGIAALGTINPVFNLAGSLLKNRYAGQNLGSLKNAYNGLNMSAALSKESRMEPTARPVIANSSEIIIPKGRQSEIGNKSFNFAPTIIIKESMGEGELLDILNGAWQRFKVAAT